MISRKLLHALTNRLKVRDIRVQGRPYLERYYVGTFLGIQIYIHRFRASDPEVEVHDHPWAWAISVILLGHYFEETLQATDYERKDPGHVTLIKGDRFH